MLPQCRHRVVSRELLDHLDVGHQPGAGKHSLEKVVAQQGRIAHPACQRGTERIHVVDALAGEGPLVEHVLVHVRNGPRVGIDAVHAGEDALEQRTATSGRQRRRYPRLKDRVALQYQPARRVNAGRVERMRHLAYQPSHGAVREPRVGVERDDVAHADRHGGWIHEGCVAGAAQQTVQLVQLAALALPADPHGLTRVPDAASVQQQETVAARRLAVLPVQPGDAGRGGGQQRRVAVGVLRRAIGPVGQQGELHLAILAGEVVDLELSHLVGNSRFRGQQHWHDNEGTERCGDPRLQLQAG